MKRYKIVILPSAYKDIQDARAWYRQHNISLPKRFFEQVSLTINHISLAPETYAIRYKEVRIANIKVFPYGIHYFILENTAVVIAIHHTAISPEQWVKRL